MLHNPSHRYSENIWNCLETNMSKQIPVKWYCISEDVILKFLFLKKACQCIHFNRTPIYGHTDHTYHMYTCNDNSNEANVMNTHTTYKKKKKKKKERKKDSPPPPPPPPPTPPKKTAAEWLAEANIRTISACNSSPVFLSSWDAPCAAATLHRAYTYSRRARSYGLPWDRIPSMAVSISCMAWLASFILSCTHTHSRHQHLTHRLHNTHQTSDVTAYTLSGIQDMNHFIDIWNIGNDSFTEAEKWHDCVSVKRTW